MLSDNFKRNAALYNIIMQIYPEYYGTNASVKYHQKALVNIVIEEENIRGTGVVEVFNQKQNVPNNSSVYCKKDNIKNGQESALVLRQVFNSVRFVHSLYKTTVYSCRRHWLPSKMIICGYKTSKHVAAHSPAQRVGIGQNIHDESNNRFNPY